MSITVLNCLDHFDRRLSRYEGRPPLFVPAELASSSAEADWSFSFSFVCGCAVVSSISGTGGTESRELPASTPGIGAGSREASSRSASSFSFSLINLSVSAENFSRSLKAKYTPGCRRNWHCTQAEKLRGVDLVTENAGRKCARTGEEVLVSWRLDRKDCLSSCGIDCMAKTRATGLWQKVVVVLKRTRIISGRDLASDSLIRLLLV